MKKKCLIRLIKEGRNYIRIHRVRLSQRSLIKLRPRARKMEKKKERTRMKTNLLEALKVRKKAKVKTKAFPSQIHHQVKDPQTAILQTNLQTDHLQIPKKRKALHHLSGKTVTPRGQRTNRPSNLQISPQARPKEEERKYKNLPEKLTNSNSKPTIASRAAQQFYQLR